MSVRQRLLAADTLEANLRFLATWSDGAVDRDWRSTVSPIRMATVEETETLRDLAQAYARLRRQAPGHRRKDYKHNSHRLIPDDEWQRLLAAARRADRGRTAASGRSVRCLNCDGEFAASRSTARYCGATCRQAGRRERTKSRSGGVSAAQRAPGGSQRRSEGPPAHGGPRVHPSPNPAS